jgi:hypothetical protein
MDRTRILLKQFIIHTDVTTLPLPMMIATGCPPLCNKGLDTTLPFRALLLPTVLFYRAHRTLPTRIHPLSHKPTTVAQALFPR